jgi:hypothetical protein
VSAVTATRTRSRKDAIRAGLLVAGLVFLVVLLVTAWRASDGVYDARAYWEAARGDPYAHAGLGRPLAYHYSPAFLQLVGPLLALPFAAFLAVWYAINATSLVLTVRWLLPFVLVTVFVADDLVVGNIEVLMALAIVLGFRWPAVWAFILLTKVTPGVGLLWFVVRREWRQLATALLSTAAVVVLSVILGGIDPWLRWAQVLQDNATAGADWPYLPVPLPIRLVIAAAVVVFGARTSRSWLVPVSATIALPALWPVNFTLLVGAIPLVTRRLGPWRWTWSA